MILHNIKGKFFAMFSILILLLAKKKKKSPTKSCLTGAAAFNLSKDNQRDSGPCNKVPANQEAGEIFLPGGN